MRRTCKCDSLLSFCAPCIWSFLRIHLSATFYETIKVYFEFSFYPLHFTFHFSRYFQRAKMFPYNEFFMAGSSPGNHENGFCFYLFRYALCSLRHAIFHVLCCPFHGQAAAMKEKNRRRDLLWEKAKDFHWKPHLISSLRYWELSSSWFL